MAAGVAVGEVGPAIGRTLRLGSFGVNGQVLGLVLGGYGEYSSHMYRLVDLAAGMKAIAHARYFDGDKHKVRSMFRARLSQRLSFLGHRAWARLRLERLHIVRGSWLGREGVEEEVEVADDEELSALNEFAYSHPENSHLF